MSRLNPSLYHGLNLFLEMRHADSVLTLDTDHWYHSDHSDQCQCLLSQMSHPLHDYIQSKNALW